jgi:hypothetical protein
MPLIVTPGTILRWHREIIRRRWARVSRRGRLNPDITRAGDGGARLRSVLRT